MNISAPTLEQYLKAKEIVSHYEREQDRLAEINKDEEDLDDGQDLTPDYYTCMCCGHVSQSSMDCGKCCGPMAENWY